MHTAISSKTTIFNPNHNASIMKFERETSAYDLVYEKDITINMPQMCIEGISENWLFREFGGVHWDLLSKGLGTNTGDLIDANGERLYASFVRIRLVGAVALNDFRENEHVRLTGKISRYGNSMYFSELSLISLEDASKVYKADLITIFSVRASDNNKSLQKSKSEVKENRVINLKKIPEFGLEYRLIKMQKLHQLNLNGHNFEVSDHIISEIEHRINPYYEVNGVGLLYFAAYPTISDSCEAQYFNMHHPSDKKWEQTYFTSSRDVMYYANCNLCDSIIYRLNSIEQVDENTIKVASSLHRKSDNALMARIYTIKHKR